MCLFLSPVLIFKFLAEKIGFFGRENLFLGLHRLLVENQDSVDRVVLVGGLSPPSSKKTVCRGPGGLLKSAKSLLTFTLYSRGSYTGKSKRFARGREHSSD